jgi:hypothetical protein
LPNRCLAEITAVSAIIPVYRQCLSNKLSYSVTAWYLTTGHTVCSFTLTKISDVIVTHLQIRCKRKNINVLFLRVRSGTAQMELSRTQDRVTLLEVLREEITYLRVSWSPCILDSRLHYLKEGDRV